MASNKLAHYKINNNLAQFFMLFHVVCSVATDKDKLLQANEIEVSDWLLEIPEW